MPRPVLATLGLLTAASLSFGLAACGNSTSDSSAPGDVVTADDGTTTVTHAFGTTTVPANPQRVAAVGWNNQEVALALGIVPVGMSKASWGDDNDDGIMPWVEDKIAELGGPTPVLFAETDGLPFEQIAETNPDVILAAYSGISQEDYETLSKIAPVIAYPEAGWSTTLPEMIELDSAGLNRVEEGKELLQHLDEKVAASFDRHPNLREASVLFMSFSTTSPSSIGFYTTTDPRVAFLERAGMTMPKVVAEDSAANPEQFYVERSAENPEDFADVDLVIAYGEPSKLAEMQANPLLNSIPAIRDGHVAFLSEDPLGASASPTPLSIDWGVDRYVDLLAAAL